MSLSANKFLFVVIFISCYAFVSCKKDDAPPSLQIGTYTGNKAADYSSVRLFTKSGEVKDQNVINAYKAKYATDLTPADGGGSTPDSFFVIDQNTVKYNNKNFGVTKMDAYYQFRSIDTLKVMGLIEPLTYNVTKYKRYYTAVPFPPLQGYDLITTFEYYYASPATDGLVFPMINLIRFANITSATGNITSSYNYYRINNVFDEKFPVNTLNTDSVLVQTYNVYYKKR
jgi:hypothetical protein